MSSVTSAILRNRRLVLALQVVVGLFFLGLWEVLTVTHVINPFALSEPWQVATFIGDWFRSGVIWPHIGTTLEVAAIGLVIGIVIGTFIGVLSGTIPWFKYYVTPITSFMNSIPRIALIPIFLVWLGFGAKSQIVIVIVNVVFLIAVTVQSAVDEIQGVFVVNARALGATWPQLIRTVYLPGVAIWVISVTRQSVGHSLVAAIIAEFFGSQRGLGYLIDYALQTFNTRELYSAIVVTSVLALIIDSLLRQVDRRVGRYLPG